MTEPQEPHTPSWAKPDPQQPQQPVTWGQQPPPPPSGPPMPPPPGYTPPPAGWAPPQPGWVPPTPQKRNPKVLAAVGGSLAVVLTLIGLALASKHDSTTVTADTAPTAAATDDAGADLSTDDPATDDPATDDTTADTATADSTSNSKAAALYSWYTSGGEDHLNAIVKDAGSISASASSGDVQGVSDGCTTLSTDVGDARAGDPIPDAEAQAHWAKALSSYQKAAAHCIAGASGMDADLLRQSTSEIGQASLELQAITDRITEIQSQG